MRTRIWLLTLLGCLGNCSLLLAAEPAKGPPSPSELAATIDRMMAARSQADSSAVAPIADDATFLRRVTLDLVGRIPTVAETRAFLEDSRPHKRKRLIEQLTQSPAYARHWATIWRHHWIPQAEVGQTQLADEIDAWLVRQFQQNTRYDRIVADLLLAPARGSNQSVPATFLAAGEFKPENLAANTTRVFLGLNLDCAQCHNHPFAEWTRNQFWETAAFFTRVPKASTVAALEIAIPDTKRTVRPKLLTEPQPQWPAEITADTGRQILTQWLIAKQNPYFARNAVNRLWAELFGIGFIEPLDDLSSDLPVAHADVLAELTRAFQASDYDLRYLTQALVLTQAYQRSSRSPEGGTGSGPFARARVRGLTGEQLYDSLLTAAGLPPERNDLNRSTERSERDRFVQQFRIDRPGTAQRSILQSLTMMNGARITRLTDPQRVPLLQGLIDAPFLTSSDQIESLVLATLNRFPTTEETATLAAYLESAAAKQQSSQALSDLFWALLNSSEFNTNH
ncbi:DUF1549 domain-containing protein [Tuwongella immobilis]|uniref:DUF1549 domain-containing protein n=1 Tax=Tuwongella immobilis TaxID=692036 RepID=A0A6C2YV73_9BACT|nr:DUF1549 domain-containing protein [Tuwongella immobilis]VIP04772.1 Uncharacterized protein OS=Pirellula staleyi (strain ATCC 27377 / DSM 6068 / ICPB 4128) GN=Psta_0325 PE=4 SV=1: PSCyt2: PSD1 [Tuwongella immobilis]VTS06903.1 Uncharacterized protein OS=Pirellula staleyi (strain ATCC 27377 / DSM 6068 / ICPB 4128) GN=Psta_0325 PE=4 SV=1: PSCyt2: PSD1 [Tuwongella immobilis]